MKLASLTVSQFRCWTYREFSFSSGINYLKGPNGSGKTSILEAIHYLSSGRSFRASRDTTCLEWGASSFSINGTVRSEKDQPSSYDLSLSYRKSETSSRDRKKIAKLDGEAINRLSELRNHLITNIFTPEDMDLLKGGPSVRREFLDQSLIVLTSNYLSALKEYEQTRRQRNSLLKNPSPDSLLLDQYDDTLIENAKEIISARKELIPELEAELRKTAGMLLECDEDSLSLDYRPDSDRDSYEDTLTSARDTDLEKGHTTRGPHRDDWMVKIRGRPVDRFASQGELRALLLALNISINRVIINQISRVPVMLLDDLESEIDSDRKSRVLSLLNRSPSQVIISGTGGLDPSALGESSDRILSLEKG